MQLMAKVEMTGLHIRAAIPAEREALEALQLRASLSNAGDREAMLANPAAVYLPPEQIQDGRVFVAESDGAVVGFAALLPRSDGKMEMDGLFVEPDRQGRGIGRALVEHSAEFARATGSPALHVIGNPHAEGFYLRCGFALVGATRTRFGHASLLEKAL
jgi:GNAT superfamily N-acetyltransferase